MKVAREEVDLLWSDARVTKTAHQLGCGKEELLGRKLDCPQDKLGSVIGKKGSNVRQLMEKDAVQINVRKEGGIRIMGSLGALDAASNDLSKVIERKEEAVEVDPVVVSYLTSRGIAAVESMRERHPDVHLSVQRKSKNIPIRGLPTDIEKVKKELLSMDVATKALDLPLGESAMIIGKQGATVEKLVSDHQAAIDVERKETSSHVTISGPPDRVEAALLEIEALASKARETAHRISVDPNAKAALLLESGAGIQSIAKKVNEKIESGYVALNFDGDSLVLRGKAMNVEPVQQLAEDLIRELEGTIVKINVDPAVVPAIIGKGGETIKSLKGDRPVNVEVDRDIGLVTLCGLDPAAVSGVEEAVKGLVAKNDVERVALDESTYKSQIKDVIRLKSKAVGALCTMVCDDESCTIVLRGESGKVKEAACIVRDFVSSNRKDEVVVGAKDLQTLLAGGKSSKIVEISAEYGVKIHSDRDRCVVEVVGTAEGVTNAVQALNRFLIGGDGFEVAKVSLNEQTLGIVIGKGGRTKADLQKKFENVSIAVDDTTSTITLRGPQEQTESCRSEIYRLVTTAQVSKKVAITKEIHGQLKQANTAKMIMRDVPVMIILSDESATVRGYSGDVRHAVALLNDAICGRYESSLALPSSQFRHLQETFSDRSHLERVMNQSGSTVALQPSDETVVFSGSRDVVKAGKLEFFKLVDFLLDSSFARFALSAPLVASVGSTVTLSEIAAASRASLQLDHDTSYVLIFAGDSGNTTKALDLLRSKVQEAETLFFELKYDAADDWLLSSFIGKRGARVNALRKEIKCNIDVDSSERRIVVRGDDVDLVSNARAAFDELISKLRDECSVMLLTENDLPAFIGRGGKGIDAFAKEHNVEVNVIKKQPPSVRITGEADAVAAATGALKDWAAKRARGREELQATETLQLMRKDIPAVMGAKGSTVNALQREFGCKIDVDRTTSVLTVRGSSADQRTAVLEKIRSIIKESEPSLVQETIVLTAEQVPAVIGAGGAVINALQKGSGCKVDIDRKTSTVTVRGESADKCVAVVRRIEEILAAREKEPEHASQASVQLAQEQVPTVIGTRGAVINALQKDSGCKIDVDRNTALVTIRGGSAAMRAEIVKMIHAIIAGGGDVALGGSVSTPKRSKEKPKPKETAVTGDDSLQKTKSQQSSIRAADFPELEKSSGEGSVGDSVEACDTTLAHLNLNHPPETSWASIVGH